MNKSNKTKDFRLNDLIFAKVRGHKPWPAQLVNIDSISYKKVTKYKVKFCVTNEFAVVNKCDICHFNENESKYHPDSIALRSRKVYKTALIEIGKLWEASKLLNVVGDPMLTNTPKSPNSSCKKNKIIVLNAQHQI